MDELPVPEITQEKCDVMLSNYATKALEFPVIEPASYLHGSHGKVLHLLLHDILMLVFEYCVILLLNYASPYRLYTLDSFL